MLVIGLLLVACGTATAPTTVPATPVASPTATAPLPSGATASRVLRTPTPAETPRVVTRASGTAVRRTPTRTAGTPSSSIASAALIEQAIARLLDNYVDYAELLNRGNLYAIAYDSAVQTLQAAGVSPQVARPTFTGDSSRDGIVFRQAYLTLVQLAGPAVNQTLLAYEAIRAVVATVAECHTFFVDLEQRRLAETMQQGEIGVYLRPHTHPVVIGDVYPGTPAEQYGLRPGDAILAVDGTAVTSMTAVQLHALLRGPAGTRVTLTIQRPGEATGRTLTLTRDRFTVPVLTSRLLPGPQGTLVGYLRLYAFLPTAEQEVQQALASFAQQGVSGWVLDLRDNGGGAVESLASLASRFIPDGQPVGYTIGRSGRVEPLATDARRYVARQPPFAVLINGGSASASEAFAAAAQDYGFARLFGQPSAGCVAGATTFPLADGSAISITTDKLVSPKRRELNRRGVQPDTAVPAQQADTLDPVLAAALQWLATQR